MEKHQEIFTRYLRSDIRRNGKIAHRFLDWIVDKNIYRCDDCGRYGQLGTEVNYLGDSNRISCDDCTVNVWGWYILDDDKTDRIALECNAPVGSEIQFLLAQAREFGQCGNEGQLVEWGKE